MLQHAWGKRCRMRIIRVMVAILIVILLILAACTRLAPTAPIPVPSPEEVLIFGREFRPGILTVPVGTKVTWISKELEGHTVTSNTGLFNGVLASFGSFSYTFTERGSFEYRCEIRSEMSGTVIVE